MTSRRDVLLAAGSGLALATLSPMALAQAGAVTLAGVKFDPEVTVGGQRLQLNGAGVRFRAVFKVYAAAMYSTTKITTNEAAIRTGAVPRRLQMVALRNVKGDDFGKLFTRSIEDNVSREEFAKNLQNVVRMGQIFADARNFNEKDVITVDFVPGTGTVIGHKGKQIGEPFAGTEFHTVMMKIWFGQKPADEALRVALLGGTSTANQNL
jgi:hypothetical protein